ncbi:MAG: polyketide antibiotic transporter, partial [Propionibacteriaceae bacterium]|nr:polyketide antibiotic transporter [Propionibacteriaceae bacterium]
MIRMLRALARRDRVQLPIWVFSLALVVAASASAVSAEFNTEQDRTNVLRLALATPGLLALRGVPNGSSLGSLVFFQIFAFVAVVAALMNTFLATRHGRADEEQGRRELIASAPIARTLPLTATLILGTLANLLLAVLVAGAFSLGGLDAAGAIVAGLALGVTGFAFLGFG